MKLLRQSVWVFLAMVLLDVVFALYIKATADDRILAASSWAAAIQICNVFVVTRFVQDKRLVVPCALGAFVGTGLALVWI